MGFFIRGGKYTSKWFIEFLIVVENLIYINWDVEFTKGRGTCNLSETTESLYLFI